MAGQDDATDAEIARLLVSSPQITASHDHDQFPSLALCIAARPTARAQGRRASPWLLAAFGGARAAASRRQAATAAVMANLSGLAFAVLTFIVQAAENPEQYYEYDFGEHEHDDDSDADPDYGSGAQPRKKKGAFGQAGGLTGRQASLLVLLAAHWCCTP